VRRHFCEPALSKGDGRQRHAYCSGAER
jgi:hypothetical protein